DHRDLHSFPTRRSSNLIWRVRLDAGLSGCTQAGDPHRRPRTERPGWFGEPSGCPDDALRLTDISLHLSAARQSPRYAVTTRDRTAGPGGEPCTRVGAFRARRPPSDAADHRGIPGGAAAERGLRVTSRPSAGTRSTGVAHQWAGQGVRARLDGGRI